MNIIRTVGHSEGSVLALLVLNSMFRSGMVDKLVTHANIEEFGLTPLSGDRSGYMPLLLKTKMMPSYKAWIKNGLSVSLN